MLMEAFEALNSLSAIPAWRDYKLLWPIIIQVVIQNNKKSRSARVLMTTTRWDDDYY